MSDESIPASAPSSVPTPSRGVLVLAYSGGLDTSCILVWLIEQGYSVVAYMANLGQDEDFPAAEAKARKLGATDVVVEDLREELVEDFAWPALQGNCLYEGQYLLGTAIARPCIVKGLVRAARRYSAGFISHGATGKGNDQIRFEFGCAALLPSVKVVSPWREPSFYERFQGRQDLFLYAEANNIPLPVTPRQPWSIDANILHVSYESGVLEDPSIPAPPGLCQMTTDPEAAPDLPQLLTVHFAGGIPIRVRVGGTSHGQQKEGSKVTEQKEEEVTGSLAVFIAVNNAAAKHGVGRLDIVENRFLGLKSRGVYETPGLTVLRTAHMDLESVCLDREVMKIKTRLADDLAQQIYNGLWYSPECEYTRKCIAASQQHVTGAVTLQLYKGCARVVSRQATEGNSLYSKELVSMDHHTGYDPTHATGFIAIHALRLRQYSSNRAAQQQQQN